METFIKCVWVFLAGCLGIGFVLLPIVLFIIIYFVIPIAILVFLVKYRKDILRCLQELLKRLGK